MSMSQYIAQNICNLTSYRILLYCSNHKAYTVRYRTNNLRHSHSAQFYSVRSVLYHIASHQTTTHLLTMNNLSTCFSTSIYHINHAYIHGVSQARIFHFAFCNEYTHTHNGPLNGRRNLFRWRWMPSLISIIFAHALEIGNQILRTTTTQRE